MRQVDSWGPVVETKEIICLFMAVIYRRGADDGLEEESVKSSPLPVFVQFTSRVVFLKFGSITF